MNAITANGGYSPARPAFKNELFKPSESAFSEEEITRANQRHDQLFGPPGDLRVPLNFWTPSPPNLDKSWPNEELDRVVWEWMTRESVILSLL